jgi:deoxyribodipyrimidine photo-lyase
MRQLYETGWMHNRVRMIVASFLTKDLMLHWRHGARWFWDTLVDADLADNTFNWQWTAGCGADAQPFFRIFNPVSQSERYDPDGDYIRRYVPELSDLPDDAIHAPWEESDARLRALGVTLGDTYPRPIVDHSEAREEALAAYEQVK